MNHHRDTETADFSVPLSENSDYPKHASAACRPAGTGTEQVRTWWSDHREGCALRVGDRNARNYGAAGYLPVKQEIVPLDGGANAVCGANVKKPSSVVGDGLDRSAVTIGGFGSWADSADGKKYRPQPTVIKKEAAAVAIILHTRRRLSACLCFRPRSYAARLSGFLKISYAALMSLKRFAALGSPPLTSGWDLLANA